MIFSYFVHFATWGDSSNIWISLQPTSTLITFPSQFSFIHAFYLSFSQIPRSSRKKWKTFKTFCFSVYCLLLSSLGQVHSWSIPCHHFQQTSMVTERRQDDSKDNMTFRTQYTFFLWCTKQTTKPIIQSYWGSLTLKWIRSCSRSNLSMFFL